MGQRSLEDVVGIMGHQLRALGHKIVWETDNNRFISGPSGYNVIVEGFTEGNIPVFADAYANGARFLCLATEEPTPKGFNHGTQKEMVYRQEWFPRAMPYFDAIFYLVPGQHVHDWYSQWKPSAYVELGYAPTLIRQETQREPAFDFGFYGSLSKRRLRLLKKLANTIDPFGTRKAVRLMTDFKTQVERDRAMQEAKVILQIRKFDEMGLVSSSRCNTALCLGRPVVAEPHELSKPWDEIVRFTRDEKDFIDTAIGVRAAWRGVHASQLAKFKERLSPEVCVGAALRAVELEKRLAA